MARYFKDELWSGFCSRSSIFFPIYNLWLLRKYLLYSQSISMVQGKYKVYNLCSERLYDASLFEGKVRSDFIKILLHALLGDGKEHFCWILISTSLSFCRWLVFHLMITIAPLYNLYYHFVRVHIHGWRRILKMSWLCTARRVWQGLVWWYPVFFCT